MKRDVMQAAGLEVFAEIAIIIFFATFAFIMLRTFFGTKDRFDEASNLPLDEGTEVHS